MPEPSSVGQEREIELPVHPTTGLYKRWIFRQRLTEEITRARRHKHRFGLILLEPANRLMQPSPEACALAARALKRSLRTCDFAAQFDEERFVVLLPETPTEGAQVAGHRLLSDLRSSSKPRVRWRGALFTYPEHGTDPDALLDRVQTTLKQGRLESTVGLAAAG